MGCALVALMVGGCATPRRPTEPPPLPSGGSVEELAASIAADAKRSERESDSSVRSELASEASRDAAACLAREPQAAACRYGHAVALGLEARAHPTRAGELLKTMLESLAQAEAADPNYDTAGPARVTALVLIRAPGWPLGPGDAEAGLVAARRAATLQPQYPPNLLALAEALAKTGDSAGARENYERARALAQALPEAADRAAWLREADQALRR
jgi:Flp pilus assembly protein TadD